jgi:glycosyltransferase involved in cell wall biosynthesis
MIKRVLYLSNFIFSEEQGGSINELEFCVVLKKYFLDNVWFALHEANSSFIKREPLFLNKNFCLMREIRLSRPYRWISEFIKLLRIINDHDIDLIVSRLSGLTFPLFFLCLFTNKKVAIKTAGTTFVDTTRDTLFQKLYRFIEKTLRVFILKRAFCIDTPTNQLLNLVQKEANNKNIFTIPNGTNIDLFNIKNHALFRKKYGFSLKDKVLGFTGTWPSEDGGLQLIDIAEKLRNHFPLLKIAIVGEDPNMAVLYKLVEEKKLQDIVRFFGKLPYSTMPEIMSAFDIGFSLIPTHILKRNGNSSQKVRQYLACGIPVISVKSGNEFIKENPFLGEVVDDPTDIPLIFEKALHLLKSNKNLNKKQMRRDFAVRNLSNYSLLQQRLNLWNSLVNKEKN